MIRVPLSAPAQFVGSVDGSRDSARPTARSLDHYHPYLRSSSVCLTTATSGDAAEIAAQKRIDRIVMAVCGAAAAVLATLHFLGALPNGL